MDRSALHARVEFRQQYDALLLVRIRTSHQRGRRLNTAQIDRYVRDTRRDVDEVSGAYHHGVFERLAPEHAYLAGEHVDRGLVLGMQVCPRAAAGRYHETVQAQALRAD